VDRPQTTELDPINIPPFWTESIRLNDHLRPSGGGGQPGARWGNGSRRNSLVGCAELIPVSPSDATGRAFSAWITAENREERLVLVASPFQVPLDGISTKLEGVFWRPSPDAQVYLALQNASPIPIEVDVQFFVHFQNVHRETLRVPPSSMELLDVVNLLRDRGLTAMGGVSLTYSSKAGEILPGQVQARGFTVDDKRGFGAPFLLHESIGDVPVDGPQELHMAGAYFGSLGKLISDAEGYSHPHLLMRNTGRQAVSPEVTIYARDEGGRPLELRPDSVTLEPQAINHLDLEEVRQRAGRTIAEGAAGVRIVHHGAATNVVAELINVDEEGHTVLYDRCRNRYFHKAPVQVAISFSLETSTHSFLMLKNVTNELQDARIVLHFDRGRKRYYISKRQIPPQHVETIDLKLLRDAKVRDANGKTLPGDVHFGGAVVISNPGAFVVSDPTFILGPAESPRSVDGSRSCAGTDTDPPPPPPHCVAAQPDLNFLTDILRWLNEELSRTPPNADRITQLKSLLQGQVDHIIANLDSYIASGCCEPQLTALEHEVSALGWPVQADVQQQRARLIAAIQQAEQKARTDYEHC
jgi:hypothetical protein